VDDEGEDNVKVDSRCPCCGGCIRIGDCQCRSCGGGGGSGSDDDPDINDDNDKDSIEDTLDRHVRCSECVCCRRDDSKWYGFIIRFVWNLLTLSSIRCVYWHYLYFVNIPHQLPVDNKERERGTLFSIIRVITVTCGCCVFIAPNQLACVSFYACTGNR
jgi:hypothetical protein